MILILTRIQLIHLNRATLKSACCLMHFAYALASIHAQINYSSTLGVLLFVLKVKRSATRRQLLEVAIDIIESLGLVLINMTWIALRCSHDHAI